MDAANILNPLGSWRAKSDWSNDLDEYKKVFRKDKALERRFQKIIIEEPDTESAIYSAWNQRKMKHTIRFKLKTKQLAAVELSERYITNRFLPDKSIDLMDEAASK
jgi:ATP-dependent Clp protease ATP-binding subunit ClpB